MWPRLVDILSNYRAILVRNRWRHVAFQYQLLRRDVEPHPLIDANYLSMTDHPQQTFLGTTSEAVSYSVGYKRKHRNRYYFPPLSNDLRIRSLTEVNTDYRLMEALLITCNKVLVLRTMPLKDGRDVK